MSRERDIEAATYRRLSRWYRGLTPERRKVIEEDDATREELARGGYIVPDPSVPYGWRLTEKGELYLHQLTLLEWLTNNPKYQKEKDKDG